MMLYWMEVRRSPMRLFLPLLVGIDLLTLFGRSTWWIGVWPQASAAAQVPSFFFGPALAAAAAWSGGRTHRSGMGEQLAVAARPPWRIEAAHLAATLTYGVIAYAVGVLAAGLVSLRQAGPGFLWPGYPLLGLCVIVLCGAIGYMVGRWSVWRFGAPITVGVALFLLLGWLGAPQPAGIGLSVLVGDPQFMVRFEAIAARLMLAVFATVLAVVLPAWLRATASTGRKIAGGVAALAFVAAVMTIGAAGPLEAMRPPPVRPVCTTTVPEVCLWPEDRKYLPAVAAMANRLAAMPTGLVTLPRVFYERGLRPGRTYYYSDFLIIEGSTWSVSPSMSGAIMSATLPSLCNASGVTSDNVRQTALFNLDAWLQVRANGEGQPSTVHGGPPIDLHAVARLAASPDATQARWVREQLSTIRATPCA